MQEPLKTDNGVTKQEMMEWLKNSDIPDNAELWLMYDEEKKKFFLEFAWSFLAGSFGDAFVDFSYPHSNMVLKEIDRSR